MGDGVNVRVAGLGVARGACLLVAVVAAALGIGFATLTIAGPSVWVFFADGSGAGSFVALPLPLRAVHAAAALLACLTVTAVALLLAELVAHVRTGPRFTLALTRTVAGLAVAVGVGTWLSAIAAAVARWSFVVLPDDVDPATADPTTLPVEWALSVQTLGPNWPVLGIAVALGVLAWITRFAERLQRDAEGLV